MHDYGTSIPHIKIPLLLQDLRQILDNWFFFCKQAHAGKAEANQVTLVMLKLV